MKKISFFMVLVMLLGTASVFAATDVPVTAVYTMEYAKTQGVNNWYFCQYKNEEVTELQIGSDGKWTNGGTYPTFNANGETTADVSSETDFKFVAPIKGMVRLRGEVKLPYEGSKQGDGAIGKIVKGKKEIWSGSAVYGASAVYDMIVPLRKGEELHFRVAAGKHNAYDWVIWKPTVEYLAMEYVPDAGEGEFYQKKNGETKKLEFNEELERYIAEDGIAFISDTNVMPTDEYSLIKRFKVSNDGRHRVLATFRSTDNRGGGSVIKVYRNNNLIWEQLFPEKEEGTMDIRVLAAKDDVIDVEVATNKFGGYNYSEWECSVSEFIGTLECKASTTLGRKTGVVSEYTLSSLIGTTQEGEGGMQYYSLQYGVKNPMTYNTANSRWESTIQSDGGYITSKAANPGYNSDAVIDVPVPQDGLLRIAGRYKISDLSDGVLSKVKLNGETIWSSRVGGERSVRWDEPYDVSYFLNDIDVVANVKKGDVLSFTFNKWRKRANDEVSFENVVLQYIGGNPVSKTTKWKLENAVVIDTAKKTVTHNGVTDPINVFVDNGTTYADGSRLAAIIGEGTANDAVAVRRFAEEAGKNVTWAADRLVLIYDGIPVLFGYSELSEIKACLENGGDLFE